MKFREFKQTERCLSLEIEVRDVVTQLNSILMQLGGIVEVPEGRKLALKLDEEPNNIKLIETRHRAPPRSYRSPAYVPPRPRHHDGDSPPERGYSRSPLDEGLSENLAEDEEDIPL